MKPLDGKTLEALATLICGDGGPHYRRGWELHEFFRDAGLDCPNHDGSTRWWWALERLKEYNVDPWGENIERIVLRLANPKEYVGKPEVLNEVVNRLNKILAIEGLKVILEGVTPKVKEITATIPEPEPSQKQFAIPFPDFVKLTGDSTLAPYLRSRWKEVVICVDSGAHLSAIILMGSILEGVLLSLVANNPGQANTTTAAPKDKSGGVKKIRDWTLSNLIDVSHECGWIQLDAKRFSHTLREYRNFVHPWEQRARKEVPDEDTCKICWEVVNAAIRDIQKYLGLI